jgi:hypothetical protein
VLQGVIDRLTEIGKCYDMEVEDWKSKVMRMSRQKSSVQIMIDRKQLENVEYFSCLGSVITNDARCACEIQSRNS